MAHMRGLFAAYQGPVPGLKINGHLMAYARAVTQICIETYGISLSGSGRTNYSVIKLLVGRKNGTLWGYTKLTRFRPDLCTSPFGLAECVTGYLDYKSGVL